MLHFVKHKCIYPPQGPSLCQRVPPRSLENWILSKSSKPVQPWNLWNESTLALKQLTMAEPTINLTSKQSCKMSQIWQIYTGIRFATNGLIKNQWGRLKKIFLNFLALHYLALEIVNRDHKEGNQKESHFMNWLCKCQANAPCLLKMCFI